MNRIKRRWDQKLGYSEPVLLVKLLIRSNGVRKYSENNEHQKWSINNNKDVDVPSTVKEKTFVKRMRNAKQPRVKDNKQIRNLRGRNSGKHGSHGILRFLVTNDKSCSKSCLKNYEALKKQYDDLLVKLDDTGFKAATYKRGLSILEGQILKYKEHEVLFSEEIALLKRSVGHKEYQMGLLRTELEKVKQEKEGFEFKIAKFEKSAKDLDQLLASQITNKSKKGFGYNVVPLTFHHFRFNRPTTLDLYRLGLEEFKEPESCFNHVKEVEPKKVREKNDAPIIEDWVSDDEDEVDPIPKVEKKTTIPTATKKEFVKPEKPVRRSVSCPKTSHPSAHKHMAPRAVLMKTGLKSVNTARPINIVRQNVNTVRARGFNAVKPSACWVWRPIKPNGASLVFNKYNYIDGRGSFVDSGCLRHMTGVTDCYLLDFKDFDGGYVTFGGGAYGGRIIGKGLPIEKPHDLWAFAGEDLRHEAQLRTRAHVASCKRKQKEIKPEGLQARLNFGFRRTKVSPRAPKGRLGRKDNRRPPVFGRIGKQVSGTQIANLQNLDTHENNDRRISVRDRLGSRDVHSRLGQRRSPSESPPSSDSEDSRRKRRRRVSSSSEDTSDNEDAETGHWKSKNKYRGDEDEDMSRPWRRQKVDAFTRRISDFSEDKKRRMPANVKTYDGTGDPDDHLKIFESAATIENWPQPVWCHMFNSTLVGNARNWFSKLPRRSIDGFEELRRAFRLNFTQRKKCAKNPVELARVKQRQGESTSAYVERYKDECIHVKACPEILKISGFMNGINNPKLIKRLNDRVPQTFDELMKRTRSFIQGEAAAADSRKGYSNNRSQEQSRRQSNDQSGSRNNSYRGQRGGRGNDKYTPLTMTPKEILATEGAKTSQVATPMRTQKRQNAWGPVLDIIGRRADYNGASYCACLIGQIS
ncbi:reverse transcriptase domain-containing protein [Tanacetum coccineum]